MKVYLSYTFSLLVVIIVLSYAYIMSTFWISTDRSIQFAVQESTETALKALRCEVTTRISFIVPLMQYLADLQAVHYGLQLDDPSIDYTAAQPLINQWLPLFKRYSVTHVFHNFLDPRYQRWSDLVCGSEPDGSNNWCGIWKNDTFYASPPSTSGTKITIQSMEPVISNPAFGISEPWLLSLPKQKVEDTGRGVFIPPYQLKNEGINDIQLSLAFQVPLRFNNSTGECTSALSAGLSMEWLGESLAKSKRHEQSFIYVVDAMTGNLLATTLENVPLWDENLTFPGIASEASLFTTNETSDSRIAEGTAEAISLFGPLLDQDAASDGEPRTMLLGDSMVSFIHVRSEDKLRNLHWVVFYNVDRSVYFGQAEEARKDVFIMAVVVTLSVVIICILTWLFVRHSLRLIAAELKIIADLRFDNPREPMLGDLRGVFDEKVRLAAAVNSFTRYVPRDLVRMLVESGKICTIAMQPQRCTVLFVDVADFTTLCEKVDMDTLSRLLAGFFKSVNAIIMEHNGVIDKYIGDCVMAVWGAPISIEHGEQLAVLCALQIVHACRVPPLSTLFEEAGFKLNVRVGIHVGDALAGNMGCDSRMNWTVVGDSVNTAARLEPLCKQYGTRILISDSIQKAVSKSVRCFHLGKAKVVGKDEPVGVYEPYAVLPPPEHVNSSLGRLQARAAALTGSLDAAMIPLEKDLAGAVDMYSSGEFAKAVEAADELSKKHGKCSKIDKLRERALEASKAFSDSDTQAWSGAFVATSK